MRASTQTKKLFKTDQSSRKNELHFLLDRNMRILWSANKKRVSTVQPYGRRTARVTTLMCMQICKL
jgi:hypothetical protein